MKHPTEDFMWFMIGFASCSLIVDVCIIIWNI
jgi:hypothetical protein